MLTAAQTADELLWIPVAVDVASVVMLIICNIHLLINKYPIVLFECQCNITLAIQQVLRSDRIESAVYQLQ